MHLLSMSLKTLPLRRLAIAVAAAITASTGVAWSQSATTAAGEAGDEAAADDALRQVRLLDRRPEFDVVTINSGGRQIRIETEILDLPGGAHAVPNPLPTSGELQLRRIGDPAGAYSVSWSQIVKIETWELMLLAEAVRLTKAKQYAEAFEYLVYLHNYYPRLPRLETVTQAHLVMEARTAFIEERFGDSLSIMMALHARNPKHPALASAAPAVSDRLIQQAWEMERYDDARRSLALLSTAFPGLQLRNVPQWRKRFQAKAGEQMRQAEAAFAAGDFGAARDAVRAARAILPDVRGGAALLQRIQTEAPEIRVGVSQLVTPDEADRNNFAGARVAALTDPLLMELAGFGVEGGEYRFRWGEVATDESGRETTIRLSPAGLRFGLAPQTLSLRVLAMADPSSRYYRPAAASLVQQVSIGAGHAAYIQWRRPPVRPTALLTTPLRGLFDDPTVETGPWYTGELLDGGLPRMRFARTASPNDADGPRYIVEQLFADDIAALTALAQGGVDAVDRIFPWQLRQAEDSPQVVVRKYRLPTVHCLRVNWGSRLLDLREFRRALCFAIDRRAIVRDVLLGGDPRPGFRPLSGPFPAGISSTDPIAYGYKQELPTRAYEPALARALVAMARGTLAKQDEELRMKTAENEDTAKGDANREEDSHEDSQQQPAASGDQAVEPAESKPLILLHSTDALARMACQSIKLYLDQAGISVELRELNPGESAAQTPHDLQYVELAVWEPLVDARRLLGPGGFAGRSTAFMNLAITRLESAENWNQVSRRLEQIHEIAHYDLPVIPLWQTFNHFAHRESLRGVNDQIVSLYQDVRQWTHQYSDAPTQ